MPDVHATLSASGSARWLACPAALALEAILDVPNTGSAYSREGTAAHNILERSLTHNREPSTFLGEVVILDEIDGRYEVVVTQEMIDAVEVCKQYADRLQARSSFYEERLDYSHIAPNGFGTGDIIKEVYEKVAPGKHVNKLYVIDYKHGAGVMVDAFENSQGMFYGLGALNTLDLLFEREIESVVIVIVQPRMDNISEWEISVEDLIKWGEEVAKPKAHKAYNLYECAVDEGESALKPEDFNPTKKGCQWCQGAKLKKCKAFAQQSFAAAVEGFSDLTTAEKADLPAIEVCKEAIKSVILLDNKDLVAAWKAKALFNSFFEKLDDEILSRMAAGESFPGLESVPTKKDRAWVEDETSVIKALRTSGLQKKDYEVVKPVSPTQAEKLLKKLKPKDFKKRYEKLEAAAIKRDAGKDKIVEKKEKTPEPFGETDLLS